MKIALMSALVTALVITGFSQAVPSSQTSLTSRIRNVERVNRTQAAQIRVLKSNDANMRTSIGVTLSIVNEISGCLKTVYPVTRYSNYWNGNPAVYTTAMDFTTEGQIPQIWIQAVEADCISTSTLKLGTRAIPR
jgi:hypothetical protein